MTCEFEFESLPIYIKQDIIYDNIFDTYQQFINQDSIKVKDTLPTNGYMIWWYNIYTLLMYTNITTYDQWPSTLPAVFISMLHSAFA